MIPRHVPGSLWITELAERKREVIAIRRGYEGRLGRRCVGHGVASEEMLS